MTGRAIAGPGREAIVRREIARPGRIRTEFVFQGTTGVYVWDGTARLAGVPPRRQPRARAAPAEAAALSAEQADFEGPLVDWKAKGHAVELVGSEALPGGPAHELKVTLKSGVVRRIWVDAADRPRGADGVDAKGARARGGVRDGLRRLPRDRRRPLRPLDRDRRAGPAAAAAHRRGDRGGEPDARRLPILPAALTQKSTCHPVGAGLGRICAFHAR